MNEQTTNAQNPFNLIDQDIASQQGIQEDSSTTTQPTNSTMPVGNATTTNPVNNEPTAQTDSQKKDFFEEIVWKGAKFFAKLMGQPDPETGIPANSPTKAEQPTTNTENQGNTENTTPQKIDFNSVMSGVTGFMDKIGQSKIVGNMTGLLDKVGDKIEEKTGANLSTTPTTENTENTKNTENQNTTETPVEIAQTETPTVQTETTTPQPVEAEAPIQPEAPTQPTEPQTPVQQ